MFGNLGLAELAILIPMMVGPIALGWFGLRAWDRRNTAAGDLYRLTQEMDALIEQNALLADELAELAMESRIASRLVEGDAAAASPAPPHLPGS